jgi:phosphatidylglycerol:prolipoprotein diacylglycerol transferase
MFVNNINPKLLEFGPFQVRYYGIIYAIGFTLLIYFLRYFSRKKYVNLDEEQINDLVFWMIIGIIVGARLFEVFVWYPGYYLKNPLEIPAVWHGGLSFHGGLVGAIIVVVWFCRKHNIKILRLMDLIVIPGALATGIGRLGNFTNSEIIGPPAPDLPWCVVFKKIDNVCRHPYQLYSMLKRFILFGVFFYILEKNIRKKDYKDGYIFWNFILWFGLGRFILDFYRLDIRYLGLSTGQWLSIVMVIVGLFVLITRYWFVKKSKNEKNEQKKEE